MTILLSIVTILLGVTISFSFNITSEKLDQSNIADSSEAGDEDEDAIG